MENNDQLVEAIKAKIATTIEATPSTFVALDLGRFSGYICIRDNNLKHPVIMSKLGEIDIILGDMLEVDILDTRILVSYEVDHSDNWELLMKLEIHFVYD